MNDLRIELRARNAVLWHAIFDHYPTVAAFCRALDEGTGRSRQSQVGGFLNLTGSPFLANGLLSPTARDICGLTGLEPDTLFPPALYAAKVTSLAVEVPHERMLSLKASLRSSEPGIDTVLETRQLIAASMSSLTRREQDVLTKRFGLNGSDAYGLADIAEEYGVGKERIRQIESKALRKMRHPVRSRPLRGCLGVSEPIVEYEE